MNENRDVLLEVASELRSLDADNKMLLQTAEALAAQRNEARGRVLELEAVNGELLRALRSILRFVERCREDGMLNCDDVGPEFMARAAIARAEGEVKP